MEQSTIDVCKRPTRYRFFLSRRMHYKTADVNAALCTKLLEVCKAHHVLTHSERPSKLIRKNCLYNTTKFIWYFCSATRENSTVYVVYRQNTRMVQLLLSCTQHCYIECSSPYILEHFQSCRSNTLTLLKCVALCYNQACHIKSNSPNVQC